MPLRKMKPTYLTIEKDQLSAFKTLDIVGEFFMYNLLKYKTYVNTDQTGEEAYKDYMRAALPFFKKAQAEVVFKGKPNLVLIGGEEKHYWDEILIVKYHSKEDFLAMITHEDYPANLRSTALEDSRLILCQ